MRGGGAYFRLEFADAAVFPPAAPVAVVAFAAPALAAPAMAEDVEGPRVSVPSDENECTESDVSKRSGTGVDGTALVRASVAGVIPVGGVAARRGVTGVWLCAVWSALDAADIGAMGATGGVAGRMGARVEGEGGGAMAPSRASRRAMRRLGDGVFSGVLLVVVMSRRGVVQGDVGRCRAMQKGVIRERVRFRDERSCNERIRYVCG